jgi:hypothetical protein
MTAKAHWLVCVKWPMGECASASNQWCGENKMILSWC